MQAVLIVVAKQMNECSLAQRESPYGDVVVEKEVRGPEPPQSAYKMYRTALKPGMDTAR